MSLYRMHGNLIRETSVEEEVGVAVVGGMATAAGWLIGSGISGVRTLVKNSGDRRLLRRAEEIVGAMESEEFDRLLALAQDFTRHYPQEWFGYYHLSGAYWMLRRYSEALAALDHAVELGYDEAAAHLTRSIMFEQMGELGKAIQESTRAAQSAEYRAEGLMIRARCLMTLGDLEQALNDSNEAIATLPDENSYSIRGHIRKARGELDECLADYSRALQLCPSSAQLLENRARIHEALGHFKDASEDRMAADQARLKAGPAGQETPISDRAMLNTPHNRPALGAAAPSPSAGGPPRRAVGLWACGIGAAVLLVVIASVIAVAHSAPIASPKPSSTPYTATYPATGGAVYAPYTTTNNVQPGSEAQDLLVQQVAADRTDVEAIVGSWVPQLSAKRPGTVADGQTYDNSSILAKYQNLRARYPSARLLWSGDWPVFSGTNYWVTIAAQPFQTADEANAWCDAQGIGADDCFAKNVSHTGSAGGSTKNR